MPDEAWTQNWKLSFQGKPIFNGSRFLAYRQMFLNHLVHHRAQLGVYLRLNGKPLPSTYGPIGRRHHGILIECGSELVRPIPRTAH